MNYVFHLIVYFDIFVLVALSLNLIVGYCGLLTLAHAGYFAIGGYGYALISLKFGWGFLPACAVAMAVSAFISLAVSLPSWRLKGDFFVLGSLAVQTLIFSALYNWSAVGAPLGSLQNLTNGPFGITGISRPRLWGWHVSTPLEMALFATSLVLICGLVLWRLQTSPWGRLLASMREDERAAKGLGKNTRLAKVQAFAISAAFAAVAGAAYASHVRYLDPSSASVDECILMLSMVIVGGVGNVRGPILGAAILIGLPEVLRFLALPDAQAANLRLLIYGMLLVLMMHFRPQGLAGRYRIE